MILLIFLFCFYFSGWRYLKLLLHSSWLTFRKQPEMPANISRLVFNVILQQLIYSESVWFLFQIASPMSDISLVACANLLSFYTLTVEVTDDSIILQFYKNFCGNLDDIIWKPPNESSKSRISKSRSKRRWSCLLERCTLVTVYKSKRVFSTGLAF